MGHSVESVTLTIKAIHYKCIIAFHALSQTSTLLRSLWRRKYIIIYILYTYTEVGLETFLFIFFNKINILLYDKDTIIDKIK